MSRHRLKKKKIAAGKQILIEGARRSGVVSHDAETREGYCGLCGHPWEWHDNVWLREGQPVKIRCRGGYLVGMSTSPCSCREHYVTILL